RAEVLYQRGRWDEARPTALAAYNQNKEHFLARWVLAQLYRDSGQLFKAEQEMLFFVRTYAKRQVTDPDELLYIGLAATERAANAPRPAKQFDLVLMEIYPPALKGDKNFWPVLYDSGRIALEKYDNKEADEYFNRALIINPRAADVLAAKGRAALQR